MFVKNNVRVGLKDIGISNKATNKAILGIKPIVTKKA